MKVLLAYTFAFVVSLFIPLSANAQMMGSITPTMQQVSPTPFPQDVQDIQTGKELYDKFKSKQISCNQLKDDDFEKIGEYVMNQRFSNTSQHIQMNERAKQMMGENGEELMHVRLGRSATDCYQNGQGGGNSMMGWVYGNMMGWNNGLLILPLLIQVAILTDLVLAGIWLLKRIRK